MADLGGEIESVVQDKGLRAELAALYACDRCRYVDWRVWLDAFT